MRDHTPIVIDKFNGLWKRGDAETCPLDHFSDGENWQSISGGFETRDGLDTYSGPGNIKRMYRYKSPSFGEGLLSLDSNGTIWHNRYSPDDMFPILTIPGLEDFDYEEFNGRAYITPIDVVTDGAGARSVHGMANEFVYVYKGDGSSARKAAGNSPTNASLKPFIAYNSQTDGKFTKGIHLIAIAFLNGADRSPSLGPEIYAVVNAPGGKEIHVNNIPIGLAGTTDREIYATKAIDPKDYDPAGSFTFYLVTTIADNVTTDIAISIADTDLVIPFVAGTFASAPSDNNALRVSNSTADGHNDFGFHLIGVVYETDTGFLTAPGPEFFGAMTFVDIRKRIQIDNIPVSPDSSVIRRHLVSTKKITNYNGDQTGFQFFFIPDGTIDNNTDTSKSVSFFDGELLEDASYLSDNFQEIPAGAGLSRYNGRLAVFNTATEEGVVYLSAPGEPEAIDQVDGVLIPTGTTDEIWNAQEFRDVFYIFKKNRTIPYVDNGDVPSLWAEQTIVDQGIGAAVHGIAQVLDSGGVNIEFMLIVHFGGLYMFNGAYIKPELSWKIEDLWLGINRNDFVDIQIMNDTISKKIYISLPNKTMLMADYSEGFDYKKIKWHKWRFNISVSTIALLNFNQLIIGSDEELA